MSLGLTIIIDGTIIVVRGFKAAGARLKASGMKAIYSTPAGGWMLDKKRLPDLLAWFESRHIAVELIDGNQQTLAYPGDGSGGDAA